MILADYIHNLLYRYDCVIVPNFGGFVTNKINARIHHNSGTFYPPNKQITFNAHLKHNDGLLANYIAATEKISFDEATKKIASAIHTWQQKIKTETITIKHLGSFSLNKEAQIIFNPKTNINYLTDAFGLSTFDVTENQKEPEKIVPLTPSVPLAPSTPLVHSTPSVPLVTAKKSNASVVLKYTVAAVVFIALSIVGWNFKQQQEEEKFFTNQEKRLQKKIQNATFIISNPLPTIELNVLKETPKVYHLIAGSFRFPKNAAKKVKQLKARGINARILGVNKWGLTQVAFKSYETRQEAYVSLFKIRKKVAKDAWLLVKKI